MIKWELSLEKHLVTGAELHHLDLPKQQQAVATSLLGIINISAFLIWFSGVVVSKAFSLKSLNGG